MNICLQRSLSTIIRHHVNVCKLAPPAPGTGQAGAGVTSGREDGGTSGGWRNYTDYGNDMMVV